MSNVSIINLLVDGDKRSVVGVNKVVCLIKKEPKLISKLLSAINPKQEAYNMRALDAIEKATRQDPVLLQSYKKVFINQLIYHKQKEIRWHVAQIIPRLQLTRNEKTRIVNIFIEDYLTSNSSIVKTNTLQALTELAISDSELVLKIKPILKQAISLGTRAMAARAKKLLLMLAKDKK